MRFRNVKHKALMVIGDMLILTGRFCAVLLSCVIVRLTELEAVSSNDESQLKPLVLKSEARSSEESVEHGQRCEEMRVPGHGEL